MKHESTTRTFFDTQNLTKTPYPLKNVENLRRIFFAHVRVGIKNLNDINSCKLQAEDGKMPWSG